MIFVALKTVPLKCIFHFKNSTDTVLFTMCVLHLPLLLVKYSALNGELLV